AASLLVLGTPAPPSMNLPADAVYGDYRFSLMGLEPKRSAEDPAMLESYRAEIQIEKMAIKK
ncbi:MAG: hypothetical protein K2P84_05315, partial [Undibacterium sp.]|nr:hypothetical protein [Undibacterium sp.]